jgi:sodium-dependent dicarboxylate transporter 2/3/5
VSTIQTICIFIGGYLVSRLVLRAGGHELFVAWLARASGGRVSRIVLGVMVGAFLLSTFVPNALTVLALIPVVSAIRRASPRAPGRFGSLLAMAVIYGGNIGGLASLVGSPANLYLLVNLRIFKVAGRQALHFVSWLVFGMPMAACLVGILWLMLRLTEGRAMGATAEAVELPTARGPLLRPALRWAWVWLAFWIGLIGLGLAAGLGSGVPWHGELWGEPVSVTWADLAGTAFTLALVLVLFVVPTRVGDQRQPLLEPKDLLREVPIKGVLFGVGVLVLLVAVAKSGVVGYLERLVPLVMPADVGPTVTILVLVLLTIFATEVLSNTAVATVLFPVSAAVARQVGFDPLELMLAVSLASTSAFMTPVATPVNALAFAGIGGVSLKVFVRNGALANLLAALWVTLWARWLIPPVLGWFGQ